MSKSGYCRIDWIMEIGCSTLEWRKMQDLIVSYSCGLSQTSIHCLHPYLKCFLKEMQDKLQVHTQIQVV